jgi:sterol 24-C-methyltransferase
MGKVGHFVYRTKTIWRSFKEIYQLPQAKIDAFVDSFEVFHHDFKDEKRLKEAYGENYYEIVHQKVKDYYAVLNLVGSLGCVEKMYIPPMIDPKKSIAQNQELFEKRMMADLNIKQGDKVLDIGCGRGRVAAHVARVTKAKVTGINIQEDQLKHGRQFAKEKRLEDLLEFQKGDLNDIPFPFPDETFNAIYHIQVFSYSKDLYKLMEELYRILKPGGRVSSCDWLTLDAYDPNNKEHVYIVNRIKPLLGAIGTPSKAEYLDAFQQAGFKIIKAEAAATRGKTDELNIEKASKEFTVIHKIVNGLVKVRILPRHFKTILEQLKDAEVFAEVERRKLATTNYHIVAEKV